MASPQPPDFSALIARIARELAGRQLPFMLIGGQAVLLHGQPRLTEDIDITLGVDPSHLHVIQQVCKALGLEPLPKDVPAFVRDTFVLPARHLETAMRVDFIFSTTPYERQAIGRAVGVILEDVSVPFATAEDLVIHKLFAGRPRDCTRPHRHRHEVRSGRGPDALARLGAFLEAFRPKRTVLVGGWHPIGRVTYQARGKLAGRSTGVGSAKWRDVRGLYKYSGRKRNSHFAIRSLYGQERVWWI